METKSQALSPRAGFLKAQAKNKSPNLKISFLPLLRESPKPSHSAKKLPKNSPKPLSKKAIKAKFQNLNQRNPQSSSLEDHSLAFRELNLDKKSDIKVSDNQEIKQKSQLIIEDLNKILEVKPNNEGFCEEKNIFRRRASCENPQAKVTRISEDLRMFKVEKNDEQDDGCQGVDSPETLKNYGEDVCLRQENEELKKKIATIEEEYCNDTNELKKTIEKIKFKNNLLRSDLDKCAGKNEILQSKCEGILESFKEKEKRYKIEIENLRSQIKEIREEMQIKNLELAQINEYMQRKRKNSKEKEQQIKNLQEKTHLLESETNAYNKELVSLKNTLKVILSELENQNCSFSSIQSNIKSLNIISIDNLTLEETLQAIKDNYNLLYTYYTKLQLDFLKLQEKSCSNENNLMNIIERLKNSSQSNIEGHMNVEHKLMRMKTFSSSNTADMVSQDNTLRLMKKINSLESQVVMYKIEVEKLNKDLAYNKKVVEEKHGLISIMEKQINSKDN